jgi:hypothetical protein
VSRPGAPITAAKALRVPRRDGMGGLLCRWCGSSDLSPTGLPGKQACDRCGFASLPLGLPKSDEPPHREG